LAALSVLVEYLEPARRRAAARQLVATLEQQYRAADTPVPDWLTELPAAVEREESVWSGCRGRATT
jgi:hypothetical protein